jgi:hypothetical protein
LNTYVPLSHERTQEILEHVAQVLTPQPMKDSRLSKLAHQFSQYDTDLLRVGIVFMKGFGAIRSGTLDAEPLVRDWTLEKGVEFRANRTVANVIALGLCAALDHVLPKLVSYGKKHSPTLLARYQLLGEKDLEAAIRPSGKRELDWPRGLLKAFSVKWDDLIGEALRDLVGARNDAAHELPQGLPDYWGDRVQAWEESATWLVQSLALRLDDLVARGR